MYRGVVVLRGRVSFALCMGMGLPQLIYEGRIVFVNVRVVIILINEHDHDYLGSGMGTDYFIVHGGRIVMFIYGGRVALVGVWGPDCFRQCIRA